ncbi:hypothetical protein QYF36_024213 [Acer negundo]|nr:hypothetical protein QYF36_024213 [Acer negundo]
MQEDQQDLAKFDIVRLHDVSVSEFAGPLSLDMGGMPNKFVSGVNGRNKFPVALNQGKKKGKSKRWEREGGQRESETEGFLQVDKKRTALVKVGRNNSGLKKQRRRIPSGVRRFHYESVWAERDDFQGLV